MREQSVNRLGTGLALVALLAAVLDVCAACGPSIGAPPRTETPLPSSGGPDRGQASLDLPSIKGLQHDGPAAASGQWLGTRWLLLGTAAGGSWEAAMPRLQADMDFIASHQLAQLVRVFIGLDQLMEWNATTGFVGFDPAAMKNLDEALGMFDALHLRVLAVVSDQEEVSSPGNFHFEALDGRHPVIRANYFTAIDQFFHLLGARQTESVNSQVVGLWLSHARELGIQAVLAHSANDSVYSLRSGALTATGRVIEAAR
jgi:hypothetical protein